MKIKGGVGGKCMCRVNYMYDYEKVEGGECVLGWFVGSMNSVWIVVR